ncbi:hypothetical protein [Rhizomonospora bruguierae]|uniref:hypothetical protein n=1 Tax=Rhizomonospora bruguierae TaxID=1581705 RepID=UPI001BD04B99|nr:hypothetical protein [Micromonospora sp. NBRC 107566]
MSNVQQPEMRRSGDSPTTTQRSEEPHPTAAPGGTHDKTGNRPVPEGQASPYGPHGKTSDDKAPDIMPSDLEDETSPS